MARIRRGRHGSISAWRCICTAKGASGRGHRPESGGMRTVSHAERKPGLGGAEVPRGKYRYSEAYGSRFLVSNGRGQYPRCGRTVAPPGLKRLGVSVKEYRQRGASYERRQTYLSVRRSASRWRVLHRTASSWIRKSKCPLCYKCTTGLIVHCAQTVPGGWVQLRWVSLRSVRLASRS